MLSLLIISSDPKKRLDYANNICETEHIDIFDRIIFAQTETIGIEDIRIIQKRALLKPFKSRQKTIIIQNAHTATIEAQNALLKILEEPPMDTNVLLLAQSTKSFLPTILSRCKVITLTDDKPDTSMVQQEAITKEFTLLSTLSLGQRLAKAQQLAEEKENASEWIKNIIQTARKNMLADPANMRVLKQIEHLQNAYALITTTNINLRFLLENLLLSLTP